MWDTKFCFPLFFGPTNRLTHCPRFWSLLTEAIVSTKDEVTDWPMEGTWITTQQSSDLSPELLILLSQSLPPHCLPLANPVLVICFALSKLLQRPAMLTTTKTSWHSLIGRPRFRKATELTEATERLLGQRRAYMALSIARYFTVPSNAPNWEQIL